MLADVIRRQGVTEDRLVQLTSDVSEIGAAGVDTHRLVERLQREVAAIADAVAALGGPDLDATEQAVEVVDWSSLDRDTAETAWRHLYEWLDGWLVPTYRITVIQLRPCWPCHPEVREELSWLRTCWYAAYRDPDATPTAAAEWHTRWLPGCLDRVHSHFARTQCSMGQHCGVTLPDHIRAAADSDLSRMALWLDEGRRDDLANRTS